MTTVTAVTATEALAVAHEALVDAVNADPLTRPTDTLDEVVAAYGAFTDGTDALKALRSLNKALAGEAAKAGDMKSTVVASTVAAVTTEACSGSRGSSATEAGPTLADTAESRFVVAVEAVENLIGEVGDENLGEFGAAVRDAIAGLANVARPSTDEAHLTKATTKALDGLASAPSTKAGGRSKDRDLDAIADPRAIYGEHAGERMAATITVDEESRGGVRIEDEEGEVHGSVSAFARKVTGGGSRNGWTFLKFESTDEALATECPEVN